MSDQSTNKELTLLGNSVGSLPASPEEATLETFPNKSPDRKYTIELDCPEFSSLCPVTGQPDAARIRISYVPGEVCLETKSVKFYLASFRNSHAFNEEIVNRILDDLIKVASPVRMNVKGEFAPRGGIRLTASASFPERE